MALEGFFSLTGSYALNVVGPSQRGSSSRLPCLSRKPQNNPYTREVSSYFGFEEASALLVDT